jgi:hypothetical protein
MDRLSSALDEPQKVGRLKALVKSEYISTYCAFREITFAERNIEPCYMIVILALE